MAHIKQNSGSDKDAVVALLDDVISGVAFGMALLDEDLNYVLFNETYAELASAGTHGAKVGENAAELVLKQLQAGQYVMPDGQDHLMFRDTLVGALRSCQTDIPLTRTDGRDLIASSKKTHLGGYLLTVTDVTDRKRAEDAELARWAAIESAVGALDEGFSLWDSDMRFIMCNDRYLRNLMPYRKSPPAKGTRGEDVLSEVYKTGIYAVPEGTTEETFTKGYMDWARGHLGPVEVNFTDGRIVVASSFETDLGGVLITTRDVTEERNSEDKARDLLYDAVESLEEGFALWDSSMGFLMCNQKYVDIVLPFREKPFEVGASTADTAREILLSGMVDIPDGVSVEAMVADIVEWTRSYGPSREFHLSDGRFIKMAVKPTKLGGFLVTAVDLTEERNSEAKARDMLLEAFQALDEGLVLADENMNFVFGNNAWKEIVFDGIEHMFPKPGESVVDNLIALVRAGHYAIPEGWSQDDYIHWMMGEMSQNGKQVPVSFTNGRHIVGSSHKTDFGGSLMFVREVTKQVGLEAELSEQREIAYQNEKLSALGELLAGVAHELNNPLSVVFGYSQMLQGKISDPVLSERVDLICQSSERAAKIVRTFLAMARQRPTKMEPCSVHDILETALEVSSYSLKSNGTEVVVELADADPMVMGDFDQLAQVFSNLIVNAGHAVAKKGADGRITVRSTCTAGQVVIEVADNGKGIPEDIRPRIFEPFFTTKDVGEGTGIGLAFSHRIVESHDGSLTVKSRLGHGAQFFVRLLDAEDPKLPKDKNPPTALRGRSVLVVDDEDGVARLISDMLRDAGFRVTTCTDPSAALRLAETQNFDAVLSDFKMPQMNGETFFRALQAVAPHNALRTGFVTGDALSAQILKFLDTSKRPHIEKPILKDELFALVTILTGEPTA